MSSEQWRSTLAMEFLEASKYAQQNPNEYVYSFRWSCSRSAFSTLEKGEEMLETMKRRTKKVLDYLEANLKAIREAGSEGEARYKMKLIKASLVKQAGAGGHYLEQSAPPPEADNYYTLA